MAQKKFRLTVLVEKEVTRIVSGKNENAALRKLKAIISAKPQKVKSKNMTLIQSWEF